MMLPVAASEKMRFGLQSNAEVFVPQRSTDVEATSSLVGSRVMIWTSSMKDALRCGTIIGGTDRRNIYWCTFQRICSDEHVVAVAAINISKHYGSGGAQCAHTVVMAGATSAVFTQCGLAWRILGSTAAAKRSAANLLNFSLNAKWFLHLLDSPQLKIIVRMLL